MAGKPDNRARIFELQHVREQTRGNVKRVAYRVRADAHAGRLAYFFQAVETRFLLSIENVGIAGFGGAQVNKLVDIELDPRQSDDRSRKHRASC